MLFIFLVVTKCRLSLIAVHYFLIIPLVFQFSAGIPLYETYYKQVSF